MPQVSETVQAGNSRFLEPDYTPEGLVDDTTTAIGLIRETGLKVPRPSTPKCNLENWRRVIDLLSIDAISNIPEEIDFHDLSNAFKTLSIKIDDNSPYDVSDIIKIDLSNEVNNKQTSEEHIRQVFKYCIEQLPPVTSALVGGYLSEVRVYGSDEYKDEVLPEGKRYGGLHRPYRRCIEVIDSCSCRIHKNKDSYPCKTSSFSCMFLHELGHTVHNIYGFLRPGDSGYEYPSSRDEIESTGCISPMSLTKRQSEFVYDVFRSYVYTHMDCYENVYYRNYGQQHPVEAFACAFEILLRNGSEEIMDEYQQFHDVFTHLI